MIHEQALAHAARFLREEFGKLVVARDARQVRRPLGDVWVVRAVLAAAGAERDVGVVEVDEQGAIAAGPGIEQVIAALGRPPQAAAPAAGDRGPGRDELALGLDFGSADDRVVDHDAVRARLRVLLAADDEGALHEARALLPRLLADAERRGAILVHMAEVERRLGNPRVAADFLEAAAREFADRFDVERLERAASIALGLVGPERFQGSTVQRLLEECRARLRPIGSMFDAPVLAGATAAERAALQAQARLLTLAPGEVLLREGDPSTAILVVRSGLFGVYLREPDGRPRFIRCCFPGWLLGETSVLVDGRPACSATVRAERVCQVWRVEAAVVRRLMAASPELAGRIAATKTTHRLASFFSLHEEMGQLHARVRDRVIGCVARIVRLDEELQLLAAGTVPPFAYLVASGEVAVWGGPDVSGPPSEIVGADRFLGARDALHGIASGITAVARPGATVVLFDGERLRALAVASPDQVAAVLERLG